jgi:SsrA-binding protein
VAKRVVCTNKKAYHDYSVEATVEAGLALTGPEVKSLRAGRANLRDGYASIDHNEVWLHNVHISPYSHATQDRPDPLRTRKLLLNRREINKLLGKVMEKGVALIPLKIYFNDKGKLKLELALARGKKQYDKREVLKRKDTDREIERAYKNR